MPACDLCGAADDLTHSCNHCGGTFCPAHTLPENHQCPGLRTDAVGAGKSEFTDSGESDDGTELGSKENPRVVDNSPDYKSSPDVAVDGSVADNQSESKDDASRQHDGISIRSRMKRAVVGGFVSPQYRGQCPNCGQYVSEHVRSTSAGIPCCKSCGWKPGYPVLRRLTHRFNWHNWKRRMGRSAKLSLVLLTAFSLVAVFGTGISPIDNTADSIAERAGLNDDIDRVSATAADLANSTQSSSSTDASESDTTRGIDERRVEMLVHQYVNQERQERGLSAVGYDDELAGIARNHSEDMATRSYFSHESPSGDGMKDRYANAGYQCRVQTSENTYVTGGENLAQTWVYETVSTTDGSEYYDSADELARGIVDQWLNSPGHRENVLMESWESEGIGVEVKQSGKVYATQNFC